MNYSLSDQGLVLNKMTNVSNGMGFYYQQSRLPPSCMQSEHDTTIRNTSHRLWESMTSAALELINIDDDFETSFPTIEWCEDGAAVVVVVEQQQQQQQQVECSSCCCCCEIKANDIVDPCHHHHPHHHHGLVRSMRIGSRLSVLAAEPGERPCNFKRNDGYQTTRA